jgi:hypothetical protein
VADYRAGRPKFNSIPSRLSAGGSHRLAQRRAQAQRREHNSCGHLATRLSVTELLVTRRLSGSRRPLLARSGNSTPDRA